MWIDMEPSRDMGMLFSQSVIWLIKNGSCFDLSRVPFSDKRCLLQLVSHHFCRLMMWLGDSNLFLDIHCLHLGCRAIQCSINHGDRLTVTDPHRCQLGWWPWCVMDVQNVTDGTFWRLERQTCLATVTVQQRSVTSKHRHKLSGFSYQTTLQQQHPYLFPKDKNILTTLCFFHSPSFPCDSHNVTSKHVTHQGKNLYCVISMLQQLYVSNVSDHRQKHVGVHAQVWNAPCWLEFKSGITILECQSDRAGITFSLFLCTCALVMFLPRIPCQIDTLIIIGAGQSMTSRKNVQYAILKNG